MIVYKNKTQEIYLLIQAISLMSDGFHFFVAGSQMNVFVVVSSGNTKPSLHMTLHI